jgi:intein/homing endonuclease
MSKGPKVKDVAESTLSGNGNYGDQEPKEKKTPAPKNGKHHPVEISIPGTILKRDGRVVPFDVTRIEVALTKCFSSLGQQPDTSISELTRQVVNIVAAKYEQPNVEQVQDIVEMVLQAAGEYEAAKHYILYRAEHAKMRKDRPVPADVRQAFAESDAYFPTQLQKFQFYDKYSRFNYELGRRETWLETVNRAVDYLKELSEWRLPPEMYERIRQAVLNMQAAPSMRLLAMAGAAARRNNIAIYNCSYMPVDSLDAFVEALIISMSGCGVGYSVERRYVENFPRIHRQTKAAQRKLVIADSAEGWAEALRFGLETWFEGGDVQFDFSRVRPAGAPLRTKGGRASGPEPLRQTLEFVRSRILARQGSFLRPIDAHDIMCSVGNAAVSGGVRRTAMISLFDFEETEMRLCKSGDNISGNEQRWNANNSAVWPERMLEQAEVARYILEMVESGRGEPGIFSRLAANQNKPFRRKQAEFGTNPCVTGDTWVLTASGPRRVQDLVGLSHTTLIDGQGYETTNEGFWETGMRPVVRLRTKEGLSLRLTPNHKVLAVPYISRKTERYEWIEAGSLCPGDLIRIHEHRESAWEGDGSTEEGWLLGNLVGDGTFDREKAILTFWGADRNIMAERAVGMLHRNLHARSDLKGHDQVEHHRTIVGSAGLLDLAADYGIYRGHKTVTPFVEQASSAFYQGFLQGLFDADGTVVGTQSKGVSVRLAQSNLDLLQAVQRMLLRLGIAATIYENRRQAGLRMLPDGRGGSKEYDCQADHELVISGDNMLEFANRIGFSAQAKKDRLEARLSGYQRIMNRERFVATVECIEPAGEELVYDCSVPGMNAFDANGLYVHNCGEIVLRPYEFCNLSIAIARKEDTYESLRDKVEIATMIGTIQSMATFFPGLRSQWKKNCDEERLLGVDINGQMDSPVALDPEVQERLKAVAIDTNQRIAQALGINPSASVTCVKPSGNSSQLFNCSSGIHPRWAPYYIRNVRIGTHTPLYKVLRDTGAPMDPENGQMPETANTWVVHFPVKTPEGAVTRKDRTALQQCEYWLQTKERWTEHNPSVTITYHPDEVLDIIKWVWLHQDKIGGMTFLPAFDAQYEQMPYVEITEEEYNRLAAAFPEIDFAKVYRYEEEDLTTAAHELACFAGSCDV